MASTQEWDAVQAAMAKRVRAEDRHTVTATTLVGGLDISFDKNPDDACVGLVVCNMRGETVFKKFTRVRMTVPYVAGYLGFREVAHYIDVLRDVPEQYQPDIIMVDGNGQLHPRRCGSASHLGVTADRPVIGVAKSLHMIENKAGRLDEHEVRERFHEHFAHAGAVMPLMSGAEVLGAAVNTGAKNPVYVSVGNHISLDTAVNVVVRLSRGGNQRLFMNPEPVRQADQITRAALRAGKDGI